MTAPRTRFVDVIGELLKSQGAACAICDSPDRADIESAKKAGATNTLIAKALLKLGAIDPKVPTDTAARRVKRHFEAHSQKERAA